MEFEFDDADKIIKVVSVYGQPTTTSPYRSAEIDPGGANQVSSNKDFRVKYKLIQTGLSPAPPGDIRVLMDETWYIKVQDDCILSIFYLSDFYYEALYFIFAQLKEDHE